MSHHRQHTRDYLSEASDHLQTVQNSIAQFQESSTVPPEHATVINHGYSEMFQALATIADDIVDCFVLLDDPDPASLDTLRRKLTQPNTGGAFSIVRNLQFTGFYSTSILQHVVDGNRQNVSTFMTAFSLLWERVDFAIWHVNDAIREEIYNDPAFA